MRRCDHCLAAFPDAEALLERDGEVERLFCCAGCLGVWRLVREEGLGRFYEERRWEASGLPAAVRPGAAPLVDLSAYRPVVAADPGSAVSRAFLDLAAAVEKSLAGVRDELYGPEPAEITIDDAARSVRIHWTDGSSTAYSFHGLRGWCPCASCQGHSSQTKFIHTDNPRPTGHEGVGRYAVRFLWADGHSTGMYSYEWLHEIADLPECKP